MGAPPKLQRWQVKMVRMYQAELRQAALLDFDDLLVEVMMAGTLPVSLTHAHTSTRTHMFNYLLVFIISHTYVSSYLPNQR